MVKASFRWVLSQSTTLKYFFFRLFCLSNAKGLVPEGEEYAANVVWFNGTILMPDGFPGTLELLRRHDYDVAVMQTSEFQKLDGGLTCLSLRLN